MIARYGKFNPKRKLITLAVAATRYEELCALADVAGYGGNPEHKMNPGDFGLTPPADPRQGKSLCDTAKVFEIKKALELLKSGFRHGLVSDRCSGKWPKNVWSVTEDGIPMEAQIENPVLGIYHGYPMPDTDPMAIEILQRWERSLG